jgi:Ca2+-binding EF-hand superfamily protein
MMLTMISRAAAFVLVAALATPALAQSPEISGRPQDKARFDKHFRAADKDGDGALTREEARRSMPSVYRRFKEIDADNDGKVTREEIEAAFSKRAREERERLMALDTNHDGVITRDEILRNASASSRAIDSIDTNKDGNISQGELDNFIQRRYYRDIDRGIAPNVIIRGRF